MFWNDLTAAESSLAAELKINQIKSPDLDCISTIYSYIFIG